MGYWLRYSEEMTSDVKKGSQTIGQGAYMGSAPSVSVVIPTRNRVIDVVDCADTVLANDGFQELLVVDQSDGDATKNAVSKLTDPRLRYIRTETRGVTNGRNVGIDLTKGEVIAFTDDDCRVSPDWVPSIAHVFSSDPEVGVVCGRVRIPVELEGKGVAATFEPVVREWHRRYPPFGVDWGITANLAVRRSMLPKFGKFDPMLGPGSPMRAGEEPDFLFRVLRSGTKVINASEVLVDHLGVRPLGKEASVLIRGYGRGTGAALFKHVRLRDPHGTALYFRFFAASVRRVVVNAARGEHPLGIGFLLNFLSGSLESYKFRADRQQRLYTPR